MQLDRRVRSELLVHPAHRVFEVFQAIQVVLELRDHRVHLVPLDHVVTMDLQEYQEV